MFLSACELETLERYNERAHTMIRETLGPAPMKFLESLPENARLIDVGCGNGVAVNTLRALGVGPDRYLGVDPSLAQLRIAREAYPDYAFEQHSIYELGACYPETFDAFSLWCVLMHIPWKKADAALQSLRRCLKTGAVGQLSVPMGGGSFRNNFEMEVFRYDSCTLSGKLRAAGFESELFVPKEGKLLGNLRAV